MRIMHPSSPPFCTNYTYIRADSRGTVSPSGPRTGVLAPTGTRPGGTPGPGAHMPGTSPRTHAMAPAGVALSASPASRIARGAPGKMTPIDTKTTAIFGETTVPGINATVTIIVLSSSPGSRFWHPATVSIVDVRLDRLYTPNHGVPLAPNLNK